MIALAGDSLSFLALKDEACRALGQVAAFGYTGINTGDWLIAAVSVGFLLICEAGALAALKNVENGHGS